MHTSMNNAGTEWTIKPQWTDLQNISSKSLYFKFYSTWDLSILKRNISPTRNFQPSHCYYNIVSYLKLPSPPLQSQNFVSSSFLITVVHVFTKKLLISFEIVTLKILPELFNSFIFLKNICVFCDNFWYLATIIPLSISSLHWWR